MFEAQSVEDLKIDTKQTGLSSEIQSGPCVGASTKTKSEWVLCSEFFETRKITRYFKGLATIFAINFSNFIT